MSFCSVARAIAPTCTITTLEFCAAAPTYADDLIVHVGNMLTMVGDEPTYAEALVIDDDRIAFVGSVARRDEAEDWQYGRQGAGW